MTQFLRQLSIIGIGCIVGSLVGLNAFSPRWPVALLGGFLGGVTAVVLWHARDIVAAVRRQIPRPEREQVIAAAALLGRGSAMAAYSFVMNLATIWGGFLLLEKFAPPSANALSGAASLKAVCMVTLLVTVVVGDMAYTDYQLFKGGTLTSPRSPRMMRFRYWSAILIESHIIGKIIAMAVLFFIGVWALMLVLVALCVIVWAEMKVAAAGIAEAFRIVVRTIYRIPAIALSAVILVHTEATVLIFVFAAIGAGTGAFFGEPTYGVLAGCGLAFLDHLLVRKLILRLAD